jgi:hypothetical protein
VQQTETINVNRQERTASRLVVEGVSRTAFVNYVGQAMDQDASAVSSEINISIEINMSIRMGCRAAW